MHILLADDDESIALVTRLGLCRAGFTVTIVDDGRAALRAAYETAFDALLLDWNMPSLDGIDVCRRLHGDPAWQRAPILFLTGATHAAAEQEARAAGARGVIFKPFDPTTIGERVRALLAI